MNRWLPIAFFVLFPVCGLTATTADPIAGLPPGYVSEVLDNGLRVSILPDADNTVVATEVWYHVGSANEEPHNRGFAHLFEHMMFGKTTNHDKDEYANHHDRYGGEIGATTSFDETVYFSRIAPEYHTRVLELEADRMVHLVLDEENLENEKRIVSEELRLRTENDPFSRVGVAAMKAVFGEHPYAEMPSGTREDVATATLERCRAFYDRYYRPRNAHLVIVGPVDPAKKLAEVRRLFGSLPAEGVTPKDVPPLTGWDYPDETTLEEDLPPAKFAILGFAMPLPASDEYWAIALMQQLLVGGAVDPFEESLVKRRHEAVYARTNWMSFRRGSALIFTAAFLPYRSEKKAFRLMEQTRGELARMEWLTNESLASAKRTLIRRDTNAIYYAGPRAHNIGRAQWWLGDETLAFGTNDRVRAVTRDQVEDAFRTYVIEATPIRVFMTPEKVPVRVWLLGWLYPLFNR